MAFALTSCPASNSVYRFKGRTQAYNVVPPLPLGSVDAYQPCAQNPAVPAQSMEKERYGFARLWS